MGDSIKVLLSTSIKVLEQGAFQEFCLRYLPLFESKFLSLERHGATANGKTRAGTPDLIKTLPDGNHICVQCSAEKDYWLRPTNIEEWKPIKDIIKCVRNVSNISEIILCASQEIPTNQPNVKSEIIQLAKNYFSGEITILALSNFEEEMCRDLLKYSEVIKMFCPALFEYLSNYAAKVAAETKVSLYKKWSVPFNLIDSLVEEHYRRSLGGINLSQLELEIARSYKSRFQRTILANTDHIQRASVPEFLKQNKIQNNIYVLMGVPKIGKTSWVLQLCSEVESGGFKIIWFDAPYEEVDEGEFWQDFQRILLGELIGAEAINQYIDKKVGIEEIKNVLSKYGNAGKNLLIVLDNFERLSETALKSFKTLMGLLRSVPPSNNLGTILISNKKLTQIAGNFATEIYCPSWKKEELIQLLILTGLDIKDDVDKYCVLLEAFSGGHPLVAIALARRAPTIAELLKIKIEPTHSLYDEDLTEETKALLFNDILKDADTRDLVLRLSILLSRFNFNLMNFLATYVQPILRTPVKLIFDSLRGTAIEGDDKIGYQVAFIFREIASAYLTREQKIQIYDQIGSYLITPKDNVIEGDAVLDAITYALAAGNLKNVFFWTGLLIHFAGKEPSPNKEQNKYLLSRLSIVEAINFPSRKDLHLVHSIILFGLAQLYNANDDLVKANKLLMKLLDNPLKQEDLADEQYLKVAGIGKKGLSAEVMNTSVHIYLILNLLRTEDYGLALQLLSRCNIKSLISFIELFPQRGGFIYLIIQKGTLESFPKLFIKELVRNVSLENDSLLGDLFACFSSLGVMAHNENNYLLMQDILSTGIDDASSLWKLFGKIAYAQYELQGVNARKTIEMTEDTLNESSRIGIKSDQFISELQIMRGDAFFQLGEFKNACKTYYLALTTMKDELSSFKYAWVHYRMGLSTDDILSAIEHFEKAGATFDEEGLLKLKSKSEGEKAVALYQAGKIKDACNMLVSLADNYYLNNLTDYAPAATIALAATVRLPYDLKGLPFDLPEDGKVSPRMERGIFDKVLDIAKPEQGSCTAYMAFSGIFELLKERQQRKKYLQIAFEGIPLTELDKSSQLLAGFGLIEVYLEEAMLDEAKELTYKLFNESSVQVFLKNKPFLHYFFPKLDLLVENGIVSHDTYKELLDSAENSLSLVENANLNWLLADIYARKAGINGNAQEKDYEPALLLKAWNYANKSSNYDVLRDVGHQLGFRYYRELNSFQKIAEVQLSVILGICNDGGDVERLETVGQNLVNFWNVISFRRLIETDLPYWKNIRDRARNINVKSPRALHAPLMILFLLLANKVERDVAYDYARIWAIENLKHDLSQIPSEDYEYIRHIFES